MEIKHKLLKIPPELSYFADDKRRIADGETFVITEDHSINDILRYLLTITDKEEIKCLLDMVES